jgi:hypothetical protein
MLKRRKGFLAMVFVVSLWLPPRAQGEGEAMLIEQGRMLIAPFKQALMAELKAALKQGPEHAVIVCQERAPQIASRLSSQSVQIGRTSPKLRSPSNAPTAWVTPYLEAYQKSPSEATPNALLLQGGWAGYVEPIFVAEMCLPCHGERLDKDVAAILDALYPGDKARGFKAGDFRGVFWAEFRPKRPER